MKVRTITCHDIYNYSAGLQAYALQNYLTALGHEVQIIDYKHDYLSRRLSLTTAFPFPLLPRQAALPPTRLHRGQVPLQMAGQPRLVQEKPSQRISSSIRQRQARSMPLHSPQNMNARITAVREVFVCRTRVPISRRPVFANLGSPPDPPNPSLSSH